MDAKLPWMEGGPPLLHTAAFAACIASLMLAACRLWSWHQARGRQAEGGGPPLPPGSLGLPIVGETLSFLQGMRTGRHDEFVRRRVAKHGSVFKTHLFGSPTLVAPGPAANRFIFSNESKVLEMSWPSSVQAVLGPSSLIAKTGHDAKRIRHALMTFLHPRTLHAFVPAVHLSVLSFLCHHFHGRTHVKVYPLMKHLAFRVACRVLMSRDEEEELCRLEGPFMDFIRGMLQLKLDIPGTPFHRAIQARAFLRGVFGEWIQQRRMELESGGGSPQQDLLSCLLSFRDENGQPLSEDEIKDNVLLLLFAGHDTSAVTMAMLFKYLAENPECYNQVLEEQEEIARDKSEGHLDWSDLKRMKVSWRTIQETLRLQTPPNGGFRIVTHDFEYEGYRIPKGWKIYWNMNATHRNERWFHEPEKFNPSRFEGDGPLPFTFIPFGGGQRICPGYEFARMNILVFLHHVVRKFQWELVDSKEPITLDPFPRAIKGLPIKLNEKYQ